MDKKAKAKAKAKAKQINNFIEAHQLSKCGGSYRKGVVFDSSGAICRIFINFTTSKLDKHSENYDTVFYAGRGKKDNDKYFVEDTICSGNYYHSKLHICFSEVAGIKGSKHKRE